MNAKGLLSCPRGRREPFYLSTDIRHQYQYNCLPNMFEDIKLTSPETSSFPSRDAARVIAGPLGVSSVPSSFKSTPFQECRCILLSCMSCTNHCNQLQQTFKGKTSTHITPDSDKLSGRCNTTRLVLDVKLGDTLVRAEGLDAVRFRDERSAFGSQS